MKRSRFFVGGLGATPVTFAPGREGSTRRYQFIGIDDAHHESRPATPQAK
jgi:hypothetical protein